MDGAPQVVVVDDGSSDGTAQMLREKWPDVTVLTIPFHTGYAHAANAGLRLVRTEYAFLLRPDLKPGHNCLAGLLEAFLEDWAGRVFCAVPETAEEGPLPAGRGHRREGAQRRAAPRMRETLAVPDGCALYRMSALEELGWFDERHFDGLEAFDLSLRAACRGYRTLRVRGAGVLRGHSPESRGLFRRQLAAGNGAYVFYKNLPLPQRLLDGPLLFAAGAAQAASFLREGEGGAYRMARTRARALRSLERERREAFRDGITVFPENLSDASFLGMDGEGGKVYPLYLARKEPAEAAQIPHLLHVQALLLREYPAWSRLLYTTV